MRDDFQADSLSQWASYPPVQDVGYDPSLSPTSDYDAPGGRALMRVVQPTRVGALRFGFIKHVRMVVADAARLSFSYQVRTPAPNEQLEIGLACANGHRYIARVPARANEWSKAEIPLTDLHAEDGGAPAAGLGIEAVYLIANLAHADPDITYRFVIDNVALAAARDARFDVRAPEALEIEPWAALNSTVGYRLGETISIKAAAPARLASAECIIKTQDNRVVTIQPLYDNGAHGDERAGDGVWSNNSLYTLRPSDPTGVWTAQLQGMTSDGHIINTTARFIIHPTRVSNHPRLLFGASERETLIARTRNPKLAALWAKLQKDARTTRESGNLADGGAVFERLDAVHLLPTLPGYFDVLSRARARISSNAFDAYLTGDREARTAAKSAMLDVARWKTWAPPWFEAHGQHTYYPAGELAFDMAFAYDLLYDDLSDAERMMVRRALIEQAIIPAYKEYVVDDRVMANTSNWIAHSVCGALFAAAAIAGDGAASESDGRLELYVNGLLQKLEAHLSASYLPNGSYGEGISYQEFDLESLAPALVALQRVYGVDYWSHSNVLESLAYPLYTLAQPVSESLDMGDSHPPTGRTIAPLVVKSKDQTLHWYYNQFEHSSIIDFIFFDDSVAPRPPELPPSRIFKEKGNAVFRTGWGRDDAVLLYRAGPTFNHNHADQGSFLLTAFGENLVSEAGWSDYYKDPYYATYFTQAVGHNTVLVNGNPESQVIADTRQFAALDSHPRITDAITSDFYDALESELSSVYAGLLARFTRRIVFVKPYYFVIYDDLVANAKPARFDWLLHLSDRARIKTSPGLALYAGDKAALAVRTLLAPTDTELHVRDGHIPYPVFASGTPKTVPPQPDFLDLSTTEPLNAAQFLIALIPAKTVAGALLLSSSMSEVRGKDCVGLRAERAAEHDLVMFRARNVNGEVSYGDWMADAAAWTVTQDGDRVKILAAQSALSLKRAGCTLFASDRPLSLAANYEASAIDVRLSAAQPTKLQLFVGATQINVRLDERELAPQSMRYTDGMLALTIPAGQHRLMIARR